MSSTPEKGKPIEANYSKMEAGDRTLVFTTPSIEDVPKRSFKKLIYHKLKLAKNPSVAKYSSFPTHISSKSNEPSDWKRIVEIKVHRESLLKEYGENSHMYHPAQYGDELSEDEISMVTCEARSIKSSPKHKGNLAPSTYSMTDSLSISSIKSEKSDYSSVFEKPI